MASTSSSSSSSSSRQTKYNFKYFLLNFLTTEACEQAKNTLVNRLFTNKNQAIQALQVNDNLLSFTTKSGMNPGNINDWLLPPFVLIKTTTGLKKNGWCHPVDGSFQFYDSLKEFARGTHFVFRSKSSIENDMKEQAEALKVSREQAEALTKVIEELRYMSIYKCIYLYMYIYGIILI